MNELKDPLKVPLANLLLSVADDKFVLGHRNADWTGLAPILEEDIAFCAREDVLDAVPRVTGMRGTAAEISLL